MKENINPSANRYNQKQPMSQPLVSQHSIHTTVFPNIDPIPNPCLHMTVAKVRTANNDRSFVGKTCGMVSIIPVRTVLILTVAKAEMMHQNCFQVYDVRLVIRIGFDDIARADSCGILFPYCHIKHLCRALPVRKNLQVQIEPLSVITIITRATPILNVRTK